MNESYPYRMVCQYRISQMPVNLSRVSPISLELTFPGENANARQIGACKGAHFLFHLSSGFAAAGQRRAAEIQGAGQLLCIAPKYGIGRHGGAEHVEHLQIQ